MFRFITTMTFLMFLFAISVSETFGQAYNFEFGPLDQGGVITGMFGGAPGPDGVLQPNDSDFFFMASVDSVIPGNDTTFGTSDIIDFLWDPINGDPPFLAIIALSPIAELTALGQVGPGTGIIYDGPTAIEEDSPQTILTVSSKQITPEPASFCIATLGLLGLAFLRCCGRKRRERS